MLRHCGRLYEQGAACGGFVDDASGYPEFILLLHRHAQAAVPEGAVAVGHALLMALHDPIGLFLHPLLCPLDVGAYAVQQFGGVIVHPAAANLHVDGVPDVRQAVQVLLIVGQGQFQRLASVQVVLQPLHRRQSAFYLLQLGRRQAVAPSRHGQQRIDALHGHQRRRPLLFQQRPGLRGLLLAQRKLRLRQTGLLSHDPPLCRFRQRKLRPFFLYFVKFQDFLCPSHSHSFLYWAPFKFAVRPDCRPPARYFPGDTTVNPGGLQYNEYDFLFFRVPS